MPKFRGLTEVIQQQLKEFQENLTLDISNASPFSVLQGSNLPVGREQELSRGILRWGFFTWGVEAVISQDKPQT